MTGDTIISITDAVAVLKRHGFVTLDMASEFGRSDVPKITLTVSVYARKNMRLTAANVTERLMEFQAAWLSPPQT